MLAGGFALGDWLACLRHDRRLEYVCKPATMVALVAVAVLLVPAHPSVRAWFVAALILSLAGDVFLMLPRDLFLPGLGSFLLAHVAYVGGLSQLGGSPGAYLVASIAVVAYGAALSSRVLPAVWSGGHRALVGPLVAYLVVIGAMVVCALVSGSVLASLGAVSFLVSDSLIAETRFVRPHAWGQVTIMVTYHLAQGLLVVSLLR